VKPPLHLGVVPVAPHRSGCDGREIASEVAVVREEPLMDLVESRDILNSPIPALREHVQDKDEQRHVGCQHRGIVAKFTAGHEAHKLIDRLPPDATWDDLMREIYVREAIERGNMADSKAGRTRDVKEVRAKYGLPE